MLSCLFHKNSEDPQQSPKISSAKTEGKNRKSKIRKIAWQPKSTLKIKTSKTTSSKVQEHRSLSKNSKALTMAVWSRQSLSGQQTENQNLNTPTNWSHDENSLTTGGEEQKWRETQKKGVAWSTWQTKTQDQAHVTKNKTNKAGKCSTVTP